MGSRNSEETGELYKTVKAASCSYTPLRWKYVHSQVKNIFRMWRDTVAWLDGKKKVVSFPRECATKIICNIFQLSVDAPRQVASARSERFLGEHFIIN